MLVERIEYSDKYNLVRLIISGEIFYLSYDFFNDLKVSKNDEIDFELFKDIVREDDFNRCKNHALKLISYSQKTSFDIRKKLRDKKFSSESIEETINFLNEYGLIDDEAYVRAYVNDKSSLSSRSKNKIFYKLKAKSIPEDLILKYLDEISDEDEYEKALILAKRKAGDDLSFDNKQKVYRYLGGRGFSYDIINRCLGEIFK